MAVMKGRMMVAAVAVLAVVTPPAEARTELSVMTWNVCAGTNPRCGLYRADAEQLARSIGQYAVDRPIKPDVIFLEEFCTGAEGTLERWLEQRTGRRWSIRSWSILSNAGVPYACQPDRLGRSRGAQSITVAVADDAVTFQTLLLDAPPWYVKRAVVCATIPLKRVRACGTHLSSGETYDDREPGAPYRTKQVKDLMAFATQPGYWTVFGGDLNVTPPDSGAGSAAGRRAMAPAYQAYGECDQRGTSRNGQWTHSSGGVRKKLDYLFVPKGSMWRCDIAPLTALSDHRPLYIQIAL
ncbi:endonuclease/exonuclease/phosphatase family protein [Sphaerisporangium corydalis]|uniref:Endonuclease/exonuclease/phosphatase family protein n=1 Tax=Sphaerisporangium corydalis TaxID=1441875 RepID=A0ABV9EV23_9ACTN|nr:endonuclease/exonuclease/phosphatase family protein [Sphaerisporangium corydalis]